MELRSEISNGAPGSSSAGVGRLEENSDQSWKRIWKLPCPTKLQMFVWRIRHESLALCTNLERKGVKLKQSKCFFYGRAVEDGGHLFIRYKVVKEVWQELWLEKERIQLEGITGAHTMLDSVWEMDVNNRVMISTLWWQWWNIRNKVREEELTVSAAELVRRIRSSTIECAQIFQSEPKETRVGKWQPPSHDELKVNLDGAFTPDSSFGGWGVVVRDSDGQIIAARAGRQEHTQDAFQAELNAMGAAVALAADLGVLRVIFETDPQLLADAMDLQKVDSTPYAIVIEDIKFQLKLWFAKHSVRACSRNVNSVANELAHIGSTCLPNDCMQWENNVPPSVAECAFGDLPKHR
ncbi:uncharacterized protein [Aegilops tauschii subsp. strangulata]|uniref:uncharacterized protein n=1 Tax=Aegilops tauschii subsp. strangulata TaxID=200361 RepID=UPI003CC877FB